MPEDSGISRKEFLTALPRRALSAMQSWLDGRLDYLERDTTETLADQVAVIDITRCLAWGVFGCQLCYLACPRKDQAMEVIEAKPVIRTHECDGCALCVAACRTVNDLSAIKMVPGKGGEYHV